MKKIQILLALIFSVTSLSHAQKSDTVKLRYLENKLNLVEEQLKEVRRDELNYRIEKDLLKETYSNNYERINIVITIVLGIIGILGFIGIRDISSIKKEYAEELGRLGGLQNDLQAKIKDFGETKEKYDKEIGEIIKQNDEQNKKIKILELKEKISNLFKEKQYGTALEFCFAALELSPNDTVLQTRKGMIYSRTRNYTESIQTYVKIIETDPKNESALFNLAEVYLFSNQEKSSDELIEKNKEVFRNKLSGQLLELFQLFKLYNLAKAKELLAAIKPKIDMTDLETKRKRMEGWDMEDALNFTWFNQETNERYVLLNYLWYLDGQLNAKETIERLDKIEL